jgi:hypothetical protein
VLAEGSTFGPYEVRRRIAVGGMGEVYLCRHRLLDRLDAVKVLRPHLAGDSDFRRRFLREALAAGRLRHPNVVTVYTADEAEGRLFLAMEYVAGDDLGTVLDGSGPMAPARTTRMLRVVADALDAAHRAQLVHRDVKPRNLLVTAAGTSDEKVVLVDFGVSRTLDTDSEITRTGEIVGTIAYCAPEQLSRQPVTGACDQYALACVAYRCLTGDVPFPRPSQLSIMTAHLTAPPPRVTGARPDLPAAVDAVLARALAKDPHARYATCTHFVHALENALTPTASAAGVRPDPPGRELSGRDLSGRDLSGSALAGSDLSGPDGLVDAVRAGRLPRPRGADRSPPVVRVGVAADGSTLETDLVALAVRGEADATAAWIRWLLAQIVSQHRERDLCLLWAVRPVGDERWLWVNWLAHARPGAAPVAGPHVATEPDPAADLLSRLLALLATRRATAGPGDPWPRVVAVLDTRLGLRIDDAELVEAPSLGVFVVTLSRPRAPMAERVSILDLADDLSACRLSAPARPPRDGRPDAVDAAYVRDLTEG